METNPRPEAFRGGEGGVGEANTPYQVAEAISALINAATCHASHSSLGRLAALWATRLTGAHQSGVFLPTGEEGTLECAEPVGISGPVVLGAEGAGWREGTIFRGKPRWEHGFDFAVPIRSPQKPEGILAVGGANPERAHSFLPILAGTLGSLFGMTPSEPPSFVRALLGAPDPWQALPDFLDGIMRSFGTERGALFAERLDGSMAAVARVGISREYLESMLSLYPRGPGGIVKETREAVQIENTLSDVRTAFLLPLLQKEGIRSLLIVPSLWNQRVIGGFALYSSEPRCLPQAELTRATFFAEVLGMVLRAARATMILEALPTAVVFEGKGRLLPLNKAASHLVPLLQKETQPFFKKAGQERSQEEIALRVSPQETPRIFCANGVPHEGGVLAVLEDVTALREPEQKQRELVYLSSHALRDPLTSIRGHIGLAEERLRRSGHREAARQLERLKPPLKRLEGLADDLLDLARLESGEFVLHQGEVDLAALLHQILEEEGAFSPHFTLKPYEALPPVRGDQARLRRVLHHLFAYAVRFVTTGEKVSLELQRVGQEARLTFQDPGASPDPSLGYYPFGHGLGLGGHLAVRLLRLHGGRLLLPPEVGEGSFSIALPLWSSEIVRDKR